MNNTTIKEDAAIANSMGGNFATGQIGDAGNISGLPGILGCPAPVVKQNLSCWDKRRASNKKDSDKISKLVSILMRRSMPSSVLQESTTKLPTTTTTNPSGGKPPIAGIGDKLADKLPPGKAVLPKDNELAKGVNGLEMNNLNLTNVTSNLAAAAKKFPQANMNVGEIITSPRDIYRYRNAVDSATNSNTLTGVEMGLHFQDNEDDENINTNTRRSSSMRKYFQSKLN
jgi:hypothetical protein